MERRLFTLVIAALLISACGNGGQATHTPPPTSTTHVADAPERTATSIPSTSTPVPIPPSAVPSGDLFPDIYILTRLERASEERRAAVRAIREFVDSPELSLVYKGAMEGVGNNRTIVVEVYESVDTVFMVDVQNDTVVDLRVHLKTSWTTSEATKVFSCDELEQQAREFLADKNPCFGKLEGLLHLESGNKGHNYFFTWRNPQSADEVWEQTKIQVGIRVDGMIFGYSDTTGICKLSVPTPEPALAAAACDKLAFVSDQSIYLANPDGSGQVQLARSVGQFPPGGLAWSPDGKQIAYGASKGEAFSPCQDLFVLSADGTNHKRLTETWCRFGGWQWSPDSRYLGMSECNSTGCSFTVVHVETDQSICDFRVNTGYYTGHYAAADCDPVELSDGRWWYMRGPVILEEYEQRWALISTHEQFSIYSALLSPSREWAILWMEDRESQQRGWYVARSNGKDLWPLPISSHRLCDAAWSTDSQRFAIATFQDEQTHIWTAGVGDDLVPLITGLPTECLRDFEWSASGGHISFAYADQGFVVDWPSGQVYAVGKGLQDPMRWSPGADFLLVSSPLPSVWDAQAHQTIPLNDNFQACEWSPDGHWLACLDEAGVAVLNPREGKLIYTDAVHGGFVWSPAGRWLAAFTRDVGEDSYVLNIYAIDVVTHEIKHITAQASDLAWSPPCTAD